MMSLRISVLFLASAAACSTTSPPPTADAAPTPIADAAPPAVNLALERAERVLMDPEAQQLAIMAPIPEGTLRDRVEVEEGVALRVLRRGAGRPVIFIPGWTCSADFFTHQLSGLGNDHHVLAYDPRGHGGSDKPLEGNTLRQRGADLKALMTHYDIKDAVIVGWSFGILDMYAYLQAEGTDRVAGVVVLDEPPQVFVDPKAPQKWGEIPLASDGIVYFLRSVIDSRREFWTGYAGYMLGMSPEQAEGNPEISRIVELGMLTPDVVALANMADAAATDFTATAQAVSRKVPTLVLAREDWADAAAEWTTQSLPTAAFDRIPLHMSFATHPVEVNARLRAFISQLPSP